MSDPTSLPLQPAPQGVGSRRADAACILLLAALVLIAYGTSLTSMAGHTDDYWLLWEWRNDPAQVRTIFNKYGRPANGWLFTLAWQGAEEVADLWRPRAFAMIGLALLAAGNYLTLRRLDYSLEFARGLSAGMVLLPTFCVYVTWGVCCAYVYGCALALAAFWILEGAKSHPWQAQVAALIAASVVLTAAFCIYQPTGMFYVVPVMFLLASPRWNQPTWRTWLHLGLHAAVLFISLAAGFAVFQSLTGEIPDLHDVSQRAAPATNWVRKLGRFVLQPVGQSCALYFFVNDWSKLPMMSIVVGALGILFPLGAFQRLDGGFRRRATRILLLLALIPLTYLPNLLIASDFFPYRTRPAIAVAILFLLGLGASGLLRRLIADETSRRKIARAGLLAFLGVAAVINHVHLVNYFVVPSQIEWSVVQSQVIREIRTKDDSPNRVVFVMADSNQPVASRFIYDEFGYVSTSLPWVGEGMTAAAISKLAPERLAAFGRAEFVKIPREETPPPDDDEETWLIRARVVNRLGQGERQVKRADDGRGR
jgi:hypothetical protein